MRGEYYAGLPSSVNTCMYTHATNDSPLNMDTEQFSVTSLRIQTPAYSALNGFSARHPNLILTVSVLDSEGGKIHCLLP